MENLQAEIEKLIAKYQEKIAGYERIAKHFGEQDEARASAGTLIRVIDDLKYIAGIS